MQRRNSIGMISVLALALASAGPAQAGELFRVVESLANAGAHDPATAVHRIAIDARALADDELVLPLPGRESVRATLEKVERRAADDFTWRGFTAPEKRVVLTYKRGYLAGLVYVDDEVYEVRTLAEGGQGLARLDQRLFPACGGAVPAPASPLALAPPASPTAGNAFRPPSLGLDPANDIDLLAFYTAQSRDAAGGVAQIEATLQAAVDMSNTSFIDSKTVARFDLVATALSTRSDSGDMSADLNWLAGDPGSIALRNQVGADLVSLVVNSGAFCGIGFVMRDPDVSFAPSGFQVTARGCAVGNLSFAHEHGHNMGLEHDPSNGPPPATASFPWSFGHLVNGSYRTVMSYATACSSGCTRVAHFSNPDVLHAGVPTGIAEQRDNARSIDSTAPIVANFRDSGAVVQIFLDGFETGGTAAWSLVLP